jgi:hypothetical protein
MEASIMKKFSFSRSIYQAIFGELLQFFHFSHARKCVLLIIAWPIAVLRSFAKASFHALKAPKTSCQSAHSHV